MSHARGAKGAFFVVVLALFTLSIMYGGKSHRLLHRMVVNYVAHLLWW